MPRYVILYNFTDQGLKNIKDTVGRAAEVRKFNESRGFNIIGTYWTQGQYDVVSIVEAPDEESMLAGLFTGRGVDAGRPVQHRRDGKRPQHHTSRLRRVGDGERARQAPVLGRRFLACLFRRLFGGFCGLCLRVRLLVRFRRFAVA